jgi:hypothetical protein
MKLKFLFISGVKINDEQLIATINELAADQTKLDQETWRLNELTRSKECIWSRLISILRLNQTESIRHSLYNKWRRNRQKIQRDLSENHLDSVEISDKSDKEVRIDILLQIILRHLICLFHIERLV